MYLLMLASLPCCPTVLTKYPSLQNSPPQSFFFTSGQDVNISRAVMLLMICTILFGLYIGTDCTRKCTWSWSVPISMNAISYRLLISKHVSKLFVHWHRKYHSPILCRTYDVIQKHRNIMTLMDITAHTSHYIAASCGELTRSDSKIYSLERVSILRN